jgi:hypothetical protein
VPGLHKQNCEAPNSSYRIETGSADSTVQRPRDTVLSEMVTPTNVHKPRYKSPVVKAPASKNKTNIGRQPRIQASENNLNQGHQLRGSLPNAGLKSSAPALPTFTPKWKLLPTIVEAGHKHRRLHPFSLFQMNTTARSIRSLPR